jgi:glycosyltransferase involved in cell wall biosynthesis
MRLSCVVPTLNEEVNVKKFLEGYLTQTQKFHELIFVDGNSKDKTQEIIKKNMKNHPEIKLVICNRKGPAAARNDGIDNATGDYITFFDADWSFLRKNTIEKLMECINGNNIYVNVKNIQPIPFSGLRKYIYLRDKNVSLKLVNMKKCPRWDEKLGYGEDKDFSNKYHEIGFDYFGFTDNEIGLSRAEGNMNFKKILKRYIWYGRTMPKFFKKYKNKYINLKLGYVVYIISIIPIFWPIPFVRGFWKGLKNLEYGIDVPFGQGIIEIISAVGTSVGFFQWLLGIKDIGRDVQ